VSSIDKFAGISKLSTVGKISACVSDDDALLLDIADEASDDETAAAGLF
jgi:hypothetical protein